MGFSPGGHVDLANLFESLKHVEELFIWGDDDHHHHDPSFSTSWKMLFFFYGNCLSCCSTMFKLNWLLPSSRRLESVNMSGKNLWFSQMNWLNRIDGDYVVSIGINCTWLINESIVKLVSTKLVTLFFCLVEQKSCQPLIWRCLNNLSFLAWVVISHGDGTGSWSLRGVAERMLHRTQDRSLQPCPMLKHVQQCCEKCYLMLFVWIGTDLCRISNQQHLE